MKKLFLILSVILFFFMPLDASENMSLEQAIKDGLRMSGAYQNRFLSQKQAAIRLKQSSKNKLFHLELNANYVYRSETMTVEFPGVQIPGMVSIPGQSFEAGLHHNYDVFLSLSQPLFTGGVLSNAVKTDKVREAVEMNQTELEKSSLVGQIKSSFFDYRIALSRKKAAMSLHKKLELHSQKLNDLFSEGLVQKTDLLETRARLEETEMRIHECEQALDQIRIVFHQMCGHYPEEIDLDYQEEGQTREQAFRYFQEHHPILKTLQGQKKIFELQRKSTEGRYLPTVNGFAELHYGKPGIDFFEKEWTLYFQGGVVLNVPVFKWNQRSKEGRIVDIQIQKLNNQRDDFIKEASKNLNQLFSVKKALIQKIENIENMKGYSQQDAELKKALYQEKQIPNKDYLAALQAEKKYDAMKNEVLLQIEKIKVKINTLICRTKEY
ncbi:MAG: hypothetical protein GF421_12870 [Candidatus Aminicenantes bacterium]|nr:hypothetical protein [Candidatus Aminicenantes bacterium]